MVLPVVFHDLTDVSLCELDDWDGGIGALDTESQIQGLNCLTITYTGAGLRAVNMKSISSAVLTNKNIYGWITVARLAMLETAANGGLRFRVEDGTYFAEWYVSGSDTSPTAGWTCYTCNTAVHPNRHGTAPETDDTNEPNYGAITKVGFRVNLAIKGIVKWDAFRYGTTIGIKRGTSTPGEEATLERIWTVENGGDYKYGVLNKFEGVFFLQGKLLIGSTTDGEDTYFLDKSCVIVFKDAIVPTNFYSITFQGNATTNTKIYFGEKVGGSGTSGLVINAASSGKPFTLTASDINITEYGLYGCTFYQASTVTLQAYSTVKEFLDCSVIKSAEMLPDTGIVKNCTFSGALGRALRMSSISHNISDTKFVNCQTALHIPFSDIVSINNMNFYGNNPYDVEHSVIGTLTINYTNCASPPSGAKVNETGGGSTTIQSSVTLIIRKVKTGTEPTNYVRCSIHKASDMTEIMNKDADVADDQNSTYYKASQSYTTTGISVIIRAREKGYLPFEQTIVIPAGGLDVTAVWIVDPNYQA